MSTVKISINEARSVTLRALEKAGISPDDAQIIIDHILYGELAGHASHGFYRIPGIINAQKKAPQQGDITLMKGTESSALIDGANRQGLVVALKATQTAIEKAKTAGIAVVGATNYVGTIGSLGYYTRKIAETDFVGIMTANSEEAVAPWGGIDMILGTNPISISVPSEGDPIVADLATSEWAYGDIAIAMRNKESLPEGVVLDRDGNTSTDPNDADVGSQLPMARHKGYALALVFELLAGPLVGGKAGVSAVPGNDGFLIIAINPNIFGNAEEFKTKVTKLIGEVKSVRLRPGFDEVRYPGERSSLTYTRNVQMGQLEMLHFIWEDVKKLS